MDSFCFPDWFNMPAKWLISFKLISPFWLWPSSFAKLCSRSAVDAVSDQSLSERWDILKIWKLILLRLFRLDLRARDGQDGRTLVHLFPAFVFDDLAAALESLIEDVGEFFKNRLVRLLEGLLVVCGIFFIAFQWLICDLFDSLRVKGWE